LKCPTATWARSAASRTSRKVFMVSPR